MSIDRMTYEAGIARLIERVREVHRLDQEHSWTPRRKEYEAFAERAEEFANLIAEQEGSDTERIFDRRGDRVGLDGWPVESEDVTLQGLKWQVRELAAAARKAAQELPAPRTKQALPMAARGLLHLWHDCGRARPVLSDGSEIVGELNRVCFQAGIVLSRERLRGALADSLETFDRNYYDGFDLLLYR